MQLGDELRTAMAGQYETVLGASPLLIIYSGTIPANCAATIGAASALASLTLPADWMVPGAPGTVSKNGTWQANGSQSGAATFYRLWKAGGTNCQEQGTVTVTGGGGDLQVDNIAVTNGQPVTITQWDRTQSGA